MRPPWARFKGEVEAHSRAEEANQDTEKFGLFFGYILSQMRIAHVTEGHGVNPAQVESDQLGKRRFLAVLCVSLKQLPVTHRGAHCHLLINARPPEKGTPKPKRQVNLNGRQGRFVQNKPARHTDQLGRVAGGGSDKNAQQ